ncbi:MAG: hypothetical protein LUD72_07250 [Bacteroidales bacterium]|nr:hypothetical protein [Bacteroidales bacterium]
MTALKTTMAIVAVALLFATACNDKDTEWVTAPSISPTSAVVTAPDEGGSVSLTYTVSNPVDGATTTASASASWISDVSVPSEGTVTFTVAENPNADPRTARVTVTYSYTLAGTKGTASCEITVAQGNAAQPSLSVHPTEVAAAIEGGSYSFSYTIVNPAPDGQVSATTSASWISDIDCSVDGTVAFSVSENTGGLRQTTISLSYSWTNGSVSESVTVVQDHQPDAAPVDDQITTGTYTCYGNVYGEGETEWTLRIFDYDDDYAPQSTSYTGNFDFHIDGLDPDDAGDYEYYGSHMCSAAAFLDEDGALHIPTQVLNTYTNLTSGTYWIGYLACTSSSSLNYSSNFPDIVFTWDAWDECWYSDYGMFMGLWNYNQNPDYANDFAASLVECVYANMTLVKESTDIITINSASKAAAGVHKNLSDREAVTGMIAE